MQKIENKDGNPSILPFGTYRPKGIQAIWLKICHAMPTKRLALWVRKPLKKAFGEWVDIEMWGLRLRLAPYGNLTEQRLLFMPKHYDQCERAFIKEALDKGGVFFDVGANSGAYSLYAASLPQGNIQIQSFEPDPLLCERFQNNISENRLKISLNPFALGRQDSELFLQKGEGNLGQNAVIEEGQGIPVQVRTLASVVQEKKMKTIDILKIDVEGHERDVLEPFFTSIERKSWPKNIICEWLRGDQQSDAPNLLMSLGYQLQERTKMNGIFRLNQQSS